MPKITRQICKTAKMRFYLHILLLSFAAVVNGQHIFRLASFSSDVKSTLANVEEGSFLFISSSDNPNYLKNIQIETAGSFYNALDISTRMFSASSGRKIGLKVLRGLSITTTNNNTISSKLFGQLYVTTAAQAQDPNFLVYDVVARETITPTDNLSKTYVLFNVHNRSVDGFYPYYSGIISNLTQDPNSVLVMNTGIPGQQLRNVTKFFANPLNDTGVSHFFTNIEPLSIPLPVFYISATLNGPTFTMESGSIPATTINTTAVSTSGLILVNDDELAQNYTVNLNADPAYDGVCGFLYVSDLVDNVEADGFFYGAVLFAGFNYDNTEPYASREYKFYAQQLGIRPTSPNMGFYSFQYYNIKGALLPTPPTPQTNQPTNPATSRIPITSTTQKAIIPTTTKSADFKTFSILLVFSAVFQRLF
ncbi:unnamed protein product [Caenorhabditis auriculariae]|uniref:Uncharacterized protein n=1 Tax=Caenorhabditis auriculariae TaxID=2777116 RepID=A0A8S1H8B5_9PELO|nr:unnamed protein product [Caenorhabditis auriculariae]